MAPIHSGIDEDNLLAFSLMGDKIRFSSVAEISGYNTNCTSEDFTQIVAQASSLFPNACDYTASQYWCGLRPMTPNGAPIFGKGKLDNLYYNTGHGHLGWTMCAGSAKIISDLISGKNPDLDLEGMTIAST
jgi:D-amino-acid dehydrogenase